jgi:hypothetical protein
MVSVPHTVGRDQNLCVLRDGLRGARVLDRSVGILVLRALARPPHQHQVEAVVVLSVSE